MIGILKRAWFKSIRWLSDVLNSLFDYDIDDEMTDWSAYDHDPDSSFGECVESFDDPRTCNKTDKFDECLECFHAEPHDKIETDDDGSYCSQWHNCDFGVGGRVRCTQVEIDG